LEETSEGNSDIETDIVTDDDSEQFADEFDATETAGSVIAREPSDHFDVQQN
jgi:hypothetical protein